MKCEMCLREEIKRASKYGEFRLENARDAITISNSGAKCLEHYIYAAFLRTEKYKLAILPGAIR